MRRGWVGLLGLLAWVLLASGPAGAAETGVTDTEVTFGMWAAFTGPVAHLGTSTRDGFTLAVNEANAAGGIHGRKLKLVSYDDGGSPQEALAAVRRLISQDRVFALAVGSTSGATLPVIPLINQAKIPFISGTSSNVRLLEPHSPYIFRGYPNDKWQGSRLADYVAEKGKSKRPGILYVTDDYGKGAFDVLVQRFKEKYGVSFVAAEQYNKGDQDFSAQLLRIKQSNPDAVIVWAFAPDAAIIVRQARELGITVQLYGGAGTATPLFPKGAGPVGSGYLAEYPFPVLPESSSDPAMVQYREALHRLHPNGLPVGRPSEYDLLGFGAGRIAIEGLRRVGRDLTREKFITALESIKEFDPGVGFPVTFSKDNHEGTTQVRMLRLNEKIQWEVLPD
jgi:branched-chain amino acid transport system substrate-binding protein